MLLSKSALCFLLAAVSLWAAEPLSGRWLLKRQIVAGQQTDSQPLTLRVTATANAFEFAYSLPANQVQFVSMKFTSRLDGTEADVTNSNGKKIGTVTIDRAGRSEYKIRLEGPNRPTATGKLSVSPDGKTLTSESDATMPNGGQTHTTQIFELQP